MVLVLEFLALLAIFGVLLIDFWVINDLERERRENTFVTQQKLKQKDSDTPIPLGFTRQDSDFMLRICKHYRHVRKSRRKNSDPPSIQTHNIGTKKTAYSPFRADVIRCSEEYAIVDADSDHCAYVLRKGRPKKHDVDVTFYLYAKFCYQRFKVSKKIGSPAESEPTTVEVKSIDQKAGVLRRIMQNKRWKKESTL